MASLKNIKLKIQSYKKTGTVTHAMEAVSAVKMRKSQERALAGRAYAAAGLSVLERLSASADLKRHKLMSENVAGPSTAQRTRKTCVIVVTSDKGLAGSLNSGVIKHVEREFASRNLAKDDVVVVAIGRRGGDFFANRGYDVRIKHENVSDEVSEREVSAVTDAMIGWHASGEVGSCFVAYQNFVSTFEQLPTMHQIVPITSSTVRELVAGIRPARGRYAPSDTDRDEVKSAVYTIEPSADEVLSVLLPRLLNVAVFHALLEAKASEHSARMVAMKSATDKARDMAHSLTRVFNKVRQAAITREVSEITSGMEAMR